MLKLFICTSHTLEIYSAAAAAAVREKPARHQPPSMPSSLSLLQANIPLLFIIHCALNFKVVK